MDLPEPNPEIGEGETPPHEFHIENMKIAIGMPAYRGVVPIDTMLGMLQSYSKLKQQNISVNIITERECSIVSVARDKIANKFIKETDADKLIWIDDDIGFEYEHIERLLCFSTLFPVVCAVLPSREYPTKYYMKFDQDNPIINNFGLLKIEACGMGMVVTDRSVYSKLALGEYKLHDQTLTQYFDIKVEDAQLKGEDYIFMRAITRAGYDIWLDPLCEIVHIGTHRFHGDFQQWLSTLLLEGNK